MDEIQLLSQSDSCILFCTWQFVSPIIASRLYSFSIEAI